MTKYKLTITVKEVHGKCPLYQVGDKMVINEFYIDTNNSKHICMHAFSAMLTSLSAFIRGFSAKDLGIGTDADVGYLHCPDPGPPYTKGGAVIFEVKREIV